MENRIDAVYARQSVDKQDSISIESQIEFCKYELRGESCKEYTDKGYSGKNTDRPKFQELVRDIERGLIRRVIVYKLDRISRSIVDFAGMMEMFGRYNVEFVSSTEKFDTSTPMGRAMLNICIVFAQLERETIQKRVTDAYYSRCQKGYHMSGYAPYGYKLEPILMDGIRTKMMVAEPEAAEQIKLMFEMYAEPETSYGDIIRYMTERGIKVRGRPILKSTLSNMLRNVTYAQADLDMYEFFKAQGADVVNDAGDFTGQNGCYLYQGRDVAENKFSSLKGQILVLAPHEGIVSSDIWLKCRRKLMANKNFQSGREAKNTWLAGKIKCGKCGYALVSKPTNYGGYYLRCNFHMNNSKCCDGCGTLHAWVLEQVVYDEMVKKLREFQTLTGAAAIANPKLTAANVELAQTEAEIEKLLDTLTGANKTLLAYANTRIEELDAKRQELIKRIADMSATTVTAEQIDLLSGQLDNWDTVAFEDRRKVTGMMIQRVAATSERYAIEWKI